jgi:hypothetical protein
MDETPESSPWHDIDWVGWKLVDHPLDADSNGVTYVDADSGGTVTRVSIDIARGDSTAQRTGRLVFDEVRVVHQFVTRVAEAPDMVPNSFSLFPNFPNPFNPATNVMYDVPMASHVSLRVVDILGREVAIVIDRWHTPGRHSVGVDLSNRSSGTYVVELTSGGTMLRRKLLLVR